MKLNNATKNIPSKAKPPVKQNVGVKQAVIPNVKQDNSEVATTVNIAKEAPVKTVKQTVKQPVKQVAKEVPVSTPVLNTEEVTNVGIALNDKYEIKALDVLNIVVKERYLAKAKVNTEEAEEVEDTEEVEGSEESADAEYRWKIIAYCPSIEVAFRTIVDREINTAVAGGLEEIVKRITDLKVFKTKLITAYTSPQVVEEDQEDI